MSDSASRSQIPISGLVLAAAVIGGAVLLQKPYESLRPGRAPSVLEEATLGEAPVMSRLWQDPLLVVGEYAGDLEADGTRNVLAGTDPHSLEHLRGELAAVLDDLPTTRPDPSDLAPPTPARPPDVVLLPVVVAGSQWPVDVEARIRERHAVVSALGAMDYAPRWNRRIGFATTHWRTFRNPLVAHRRAAQETIVLVDDGEVPARTDDTEVQRVPYEWFVLGEDSDREVARPPHVVVLWLDSDFFGGHLLDGIDQLLTRLVSKDVLLAQGMRDGALEARLLGPPDSTSLGLLADDLAERGRTFAVDGAIRPLVLDAPAATAEQHRRSIDDLIDRFRFAPSLGELLDALDVDDRDMLVAELVETLVPVVPRGEAAELPLTAASALRAQREPFVADDVVATVDATLEQSLSAAQYGALANLRAEIGAAYATWLFARFTDLAGDLPAPSTRLVEQVVAESLRSTPDPAEPPSIREILAAQQGLPPALLGRPPGDAGRLQMIVDLHTMLDAYLDDGLPERLSEAVLVQRLDPLIEHDQTSERLASRARWVLDVLDAAAAIEAEVAAALTEALGATPVDSDLMWLDKVVDPWLYYVTYSATNDTLPWSGMETSLLGFGVGREFEADRIVDSVEQVLADFGIDGEYAVELATTAARDCVHGSRIWDGDRYQRHSQVRSLLAVGAVVADELRSMLDEPDEPEDAEALDALLAAIREAIDSYAHDRVVIRLRDADELVDDGALTDLRRIAEAVLDQADNDVVDRYTVLMAGQLTWAATEELERPRRGARLVLGNLTAAATWLGLAEEPRAGGRIGSCARSLAVVTGVIARTANREPTAARWFDDARGTLQAELRLLIDAPPATADSAGRIANNVSLDVSDRLTSALLESAYGVPDDAWRDLIRATPVYLARDPRGEQRPEVLQALGDHLARSWTDSIEAELAAGPNGEDTLARLARTLYGTSHDRRRSLASFPALKDRLANGWEGQIFEAQLRFEQAALEADFAAAVAPHSPVSMVLELQLMLEQHFDLGLDIGAGRPALLATLHGLIEDAFDGRRRFGAGPLDATFRARLVEEIDSSFAEHTDSFVSRHRVADVVQSWANRALDPPVHRSGAVTLAGVEDGKTDASLASGSIYGGAGGDSDQKSQGSAATGGATIPDDVSALLSDRQFALFEHRRFVQAQLTTILPYLVIVNSHATAWPEREFDEHKRPSSRIERLNLAAVDEAVTALLDDLAPQAERGVQRCLSTVANDGEVLGAIVAELSARGFDPAGGGDSVALVSEWDTVYGHSLPREFERALEQHCESQGVVGLGALDGPTLRLRIDAALAEANTSVADVELDAMVAAFLGTTRDRGVDLTADPFVPGLERALRRELRAAGCQVPAGQVLRRTIPHLRRALTVQPLTLPDDLITRWQYIRGLDGATAARTGASESAPQTDGRSTIQSTGRAGALGLASSEIERPEGESQFDYVRRMAQDLHAHDIHLQSQGKRLFAVGVLGSDVYDKLLILQALKERLPHVVFFTTDMDARLYHGKAGRRARNVIVASSFGLALPRGLQASLPPFRDSYQTATFAACHLALGGFGADADAITRHLWHGSLPWRRERTTSSTANAEQAAPVQVGRGWPSTLLATNDTRPPRTVFRYEIGRNRAVELEGTAPEDGARGESSRALHVLGLAGALGGLVVLLTLVYWRVPQFLVRLHRGVLPSSERRAAIAAVAVAVALFAILAGLVVGDRSEGTPEPLNPLQGVSVWPTVAIRMAAIALGVGLLLVGMVRAELAADRIETELGLRRWRPQDGEPSTAQVAGRIAAAWRGRRRPLAALLEGWRLYAISAWRPGQAGARQTWANGDKLWHEYRERGRVGFRVFRCAPPALAFLVLGLALTDNGSSAVGLTRSATSRLAETLSFHAMAFVLIVLTFVVIDATRLFERFVRLLALRPSRWNKTASRRVADERGLPHEAAGDLLDVEVISRRSTSVGSKVLYPFAMLFLLLIGRNAVFERWDWPVELLAVSVILFMAALIPAYLVRRVAERARADSIARLRLTASKIPAGGAELASEPDGRADRSTLVDRIHSAIEEIERKNIGAFSPYSRSPVVQAVLLPFGGVGLIALMELMTVLSI